MVRIFVLFVSIFLLSFHTVSAQTTIDPDVLDEISRAVVLIVGLQDGEPISTGSGTFVSSDGLIYTNRHVLEGANDFAIFVLEDVNEQPVFAYFASPTQIFPYEVDGSGLDFAVLQVDRNTDGNALLRTRIEVPAFVDPNNFRQMRRGEPIFVIGYPGIADSFQVLTQGIITTVQNGDVAGNRVPVWYQTDAEISPGNSGGLAVDAEGNPIGIPSSVVSESRTGGRLGGVLPLNFVTQVVENIPPDPLSDLWTGAGGFSQAGVTLSTASTDEELDDAMSIEITNVEFNVEIPDFEGTYAFIRTNVSARDLTGIELVVGIYFYWAPEGDFEPVPSQIDDFALRNGGLFVNDILAPETADEHWDDFVFAIPMEAFPANPNSVEIIAIPDMGIAGDRLVSPGEGYEFVIANAGVGGSGIEISCPNGSEIKNGVEITVFQMRPGFTYTATVMGLGDFDPVLAVVPTDAIEEGQASLCNDDNDAAVDYQVNVPTAGSVSGSRLDAQQAFSHSQDDLMSISLVVGDYGGGAGEFVLILEGMVYTQADGIGDAFILNLMPNIAASEISPSVYMIGAESQLDPFLYILDLDTGGILETSSGELFRCDDAGSSSTCFGVSDSLAESSVRLGNKTINADSTDAMMTIPVPTDLDSSLSLPLVMSSYEQQTTGAYTMVFHIGVR